MDNRMILSIFWNIYLEGEGALTCQKHNLQISKNVEKCQN